MGTYQKTFLQSVTDPDTFWGDAAELISWYRKPTVILDDASAPFYHWFPDGVLNTCYNALDRHVEAGRGDQTALIYDSAMTGRQATYSYTQLRDEVARFAGALSSLGVVKGDRVVIYMPMIPEAVIAMLACARLGAVHSVVFGGFAAHELALRIDDAEPKVLIYASCGLEPNRVVPYKPLVDSAIEEASHPPEKCVVFQRPEAVAPMGRLDLDWQNLIATADPVDCVPVAATDPLYILYTSGTTARPKGVVRDNGGHAVALRWTLPNIYDIHPGDVYWAASDVGWVVGHSYIVYGPLLTGCTTILYEGKPVGTPDAGSFWRVISEHGVRCLFTAPTAFRAIKKEDPQAEHLARYDISCLKYLFLAGERLDPDTYYWASETLHIPVIDHWWQTETGWPITANLMGLEPLPIKPGSPTVPVPGYDVRVVDQEGNEVPPDTEGAIVVRLPLPPGTVPTLWQDDDRYVESYLTRFPGYYLTGDGGHMDTDGYVYVMGRIDDVINVAGHRLSTGEIEEVIAGHPDVAECAVIGVRDDLKGQVPRGFAVLKAGVTRDPAEIGAELVARVREKIGAVASVREVDVVPALPKTRSGKILRATMRAIADGEKVVVPSTIDDVSALDRLRPMLRHDGPVW